MNFYVIVRGPLGVGKSTVSRKLAQVLRAEYISVDRVLDEYDIWYSGRLSEFLRVNAIVARRAGRFLTKGKPVIFDGNFYWKTQIRDLEKRLDYRHFVFTLKAPLDVCIQRDAGREAPHGSEGARAVYAKSTRFDCGIGIDATRSLDRTIRTIRSTLIHALREAPG
jgi:predicted kinase